MKVLEIAVSSSQLSNQQVHLQDGWHKELGNSHSICCLCLLMKGICEVVTGDRSYKEANVIP